MAFDIKKHFEKLENDDCYFNKTNGFAISVDEYNSFLKEETFPITTIYGNSYWLNESGKIHRIDGPAIIKKQNSECFYFVNGKQYGTDEFEDIPDTYKQKITFSNDKIKVFSELLYAPETWDRVYYKNKNRFLSLLDKI